MRSRRERERLCVCVRVRGKLKPHIFQSPLRFESISAQWTTTQANLPRLQQGHHASLSALRSLLSSWDWAHGQSMAYACVEVAPGRQWRYRLYSDSGKQVLGTKTGERQGNDARCGCSGVFIAPTDPLLPTTEERPEMETGRRWYHATFQSNIPNFQSINFDLFIL